jgi:hypothetical protein
MELYGFHSLSTKTQGDIMKNLMILSTVATFFAAASMTTAKDFNDTEVVTTLRSGALEFSVGTVDGQLNTITTGATVASYTLGRFDTDTVVSLTYGRFADTFDFTLEYNVSTIIAPQWTAYGTAAVSYVTPTIDLSAGDVYVAPTLGVSYAVTDRLSVFTDVTYTWNVSNDWAATGGALELGVIYAVTDRVSVTPSLIRTFDTGMDSTNAKLEVALSF